jgi:hypothetical protein
MMKQYPAWTAVLRRSLLAVATAGTVLAALVVEEDIRGHHARKAFEKECAEEGRPLDYAFYKPAPVSDRQNLYQAPLLRRFFTGDEAAGAAWAAYQKAMPSVAGMTLTIGDWHKGRASDLEAMLAGKAGSQASGSVVDRRAAALEIVGRLKAIEPDLDSICSAARERPLSQIPFGSTFQGQFAAMRYFTQALVVRALAELELGQNGKAFDDVYSVLRLAEGAENFPHFIHLLMSNVMVSMAFQPLWEGCGSGSWNEAQLRAFGEVLSRFHPLRRLPSAYAASRAAYVAGYFEKGAKKPFWMPDGWWMLNVVRLFQTHAAGGDPRSFDAASERIYLDEIQESEAHFHALGGSPSPINWLVRKESWSQRIPIFAGFEHASVVIGQTACALELYHRQNGRYPAELSDLEPGFQSSPPLDVIDGATLRYERLGPSRFRLYSIGTSQTAPGSWSHEWADVTRWSTKEGYWAWASR